MSQNESTRDMTQLSMSPYLLLSWGILLLGWILMLSGQAAVQEACVAGSDGYAVAVPVGGYMGPASCSKVYGYSWFICVYAFFIAVLTPVIVMKDLLGKCRACYIGLLAPLIMLAGDMSNTFITFTYADITTSFTSRCRATAAGAIISSMGAYMLLIFAGFVDEDAEKCEKSGAPTDQNTTRGGYFVETTNESRDPGSEYTSMS